MSFHKPQIIKDFCKDKIIYIKVLKLAILNQGYPSWQGGPQRGTILAGFLIWNTNRLRTDDLNKPI